MRPRPPCRPGRLRAPRQLSLAARTRGGYRAGAGRPRGRSAHYVPHVPRPKLTPNEPVHVTMRVVPGVRSLRGPIATGIIQFVFMTEREGKGFRLVHYAIRGNHLHLVCEGDDARALSRGIQRVGSRVARALNKHWRRRGRLFADRFHEHVIRSPREMRNVLAYVLLNQHKDMAAAGHTVLGIDPYSSGPFFDGWADVADYIPPSRDPPRQGEPPCPPVTCARSWLLRRGWRRHGLIRTSEKAPRTPAVGSANVAAE